MRTHSSINYAFKEDENMKKVDFLIEYEVKPREFDSMCLVAAYLESKGYTVEFVNSWECLYSRPEPCEAEVAVISACYDDGTYDYFAGMAYSFKKVVNMQWEQVLRNRVYKPHPYEFGDYIEVALKTRHVCWGEKEKAWQESMFGVPSEYLRVTGYPPLDFYRPEFKKFLVPREELFARYGLDPQKKTLLFISSFATIGLPSSEKFEDVDSIREVSIVSQKTILDWFERFVREYPDMQLIYRAHPAEKDNKDIRAIAEKYKNFFVIPEQPIRHWIAACDRFLNWWSTSAMEIYFSGKNMHVLRPVPVPDYMDLCVFEDAKFIDNYEDMEKAIFSDPPFPIPLEKLFRWYDIQDKPAYKRIGDWLIDTYKSKNYSSRPSKDNIYKRTLLGRGKQWLKNTAVFASLSYWLLNTVGENKLTKKMTAAVEHAKAEKEMHDPNSYRAQKRKQNSADAQEIESRINEFLKVINENS